MAHDSKELTLRWFREVWDGNRAQTIDELLAPDVKLHGLGPEPLNAAGFKEFHKTFQAAFSDVRMEIRECFADGERSACVFIFHARHTGGALGFAATRLPVSVLGMGIAQWRDGKIVEAYNQFDKPGMMEQLGQGA